MPEEPVYRERETIVTEDEPRDSGAPVAVIIGVVVALLLVVLLFFMFPPGGDTSPGAGDPNDGGEDVEMDLDVDMDERTDDGGQTDGGQTDGGDGDDTDTSDDP